MFAWWGGVLDDSIGGGGGGEFWGWVCEWWWWCMIGEQQHGAGCCSVCTTYSFKGGREEGSFLFYCVFEGEGEEVQSTLLMLSRCGAAARACMFL